MKDQVDEQDNLIITDNNYTRMLSNTLSTINSTYVQHNEIGLGTGKKSFGGLYQCGLGKDSLLFNIMSPFFDQGVPPGHIDGLLRDSHFYFPTDITVANDGTMLVSDRENHVIRKIVYIQP